VNKSIVTRTLGAAFIGIIGYGLAVHERTGDVPVSLPASMGVQSLPERASSDSSASRLDRFPPVHHREATEQNDAVANRGQAMDEPTTADSGGNIEIPVAPELIGETSLTDGAANRRASRNASEDAPEITGRPPTVVDVENRAGSTETARLAARLYRARYTGDATVPIEVAIEASPYRSPEAADLFGELAHYRDARVRTAAVRQLWRLAADDVDTSQPGVLRMALENAVYDNDPQVAAIAADALSDLRVRSDRQSLVGAIDAGAETLMAPETN